VTPYPYDLFFRCNESPTPAYRINDGTFTYALSKGISQNNIWKTVCLYQNAIVGEKTGCSFLMDHFTAILHIYRGYPDKSMLTHHMTLKEKNYINRVYYIAGLEDLSRNINSSGRCNSIAMAEAFTLLCHEAYTFWYVTYSDHVDLNQLYLETKDKSLYDQYYNEARIHLAANNKKIAPSRILTEEHMSTFRKAFSRSNNIPILSSR